MFKKTSLVALAAAGCVAFSGSAFASPHSSEESDGAGFNNSVNTTEQTNVQTVVRTLSNTINNTLARQMSTAMFKFTDAGTGMSAGDTWTDGVSMWGTVDVTAVDIDLDNSSEARDTNITTGVFGADKMVNDNAIVGVALSLSASNTDGKNSNNTDLSQDSRSFTVAPYAGYIINENFSIDGTLGITLSSIDTEDSNTGAVRKSDTTATTTFAAINLNYVRPLSEMFAVKASAGYSVMETDMDGFTDDNSVRFNSTEEGNWVARVGATLLANIDDRTEAYFGATYEREDAAVNMDADAARFTLGASRVLNENAVLTLEGAGTAFRDTQSELGGSINLRYSF